MSTIINFSAIIQPIIIIIHLNTPLDPVYRVIINKNRNHLPVFALSTNNIVGGHLLNMSILLRYNDNVVMEQPDNTHTIIKEEEIFGRSSGPCEFTSRTLCYITDTLRCSVFFLVCREDMEKVNIKFHDNGTVTYQHKKILQFVPEMSVNKEQRLTVPNIPLLVSFFFI